MDARALTSRSALLALACALSATACAERKAVTEPERGLGDPPAASRGLAIPVSCTVSLASRSMACRPPDGIRVDGGPQLLIVGGQGINVQLTSNNVSYDDVDEVFQADVTVQNLIGQALGTPDGTTVTGVRVFFHTGPNVTDGSGLAAVNNPDGFGDFTNTNQPFHEYVEILDTNDISAVKTWLWDVESTVNTFEFTVFVEADVEFPDGWVEVTPAPTLVDSGSATVLTATARDVVGRQVARTFTWSSSDDLIASVSNGTVTGEAGGVADITASSDGPEADGSSRVTVITPWYDIELRELTPLTPSQRQAFDDAVARWEGLVVGDLSDLQLTADADVCGYGEPALNEYIDDLLLFLVVEPIDGSGGTLGSAGFCWVRTANDLPLVARIRLDSDDVADLEADDQLVDVAKHEMAHTMGFSQWLWVQKGLLRDDSGIIFPSCNGTESDPYFNGTAAINAFDNVGGSGYGGNKVPVEEVGGPGTWCAHWRELVFETELMTGFISLPGTANPLSEVSVEAFADVGYLVDPSGADPYTLPGSAPVASQTRGRQLVELVEIGPIFAIDEQGRVTVVRQDRR